MPTGAVMSTTDDLVDLARHAGTLLRARGATLATAESCTGGLVGSLITAVPGSSDVYLGGVIAYANSAKVALLDVDPRVLSRSGAVSAPVARAMAIGARRRLVSDYAVAITGIAGPSGGTPARPVGLVYVALAAPAGVSTRRLRLSGSRAEIRAAAARAALAWLVDEIGAIAVTR
jgi:PncC family amidohydrolase